MDFLYYSYCRNPTGREFFIPAQTLIGVKLLDGSGTDTGWVDYPDPSQLNLVLGQFGNRYVE